MHGFVGLISDRAEDFDFVNRVTKLSAYNALQFTHLRSATAVENFVQQNPIHVLFWDVDSPGGSEFMNPLNVGKVSTTLSRLSQPARVISLSDTPLSENTTLHSIAPIGHSMVRNFEDPAAEICFRLVRGILAPDPFGLAQYIPDTCKVQTVIIRESGHKSLAATAIHKVLDKMKLPSRLAASAAQAADELMVNAIFDAPRTFSTIGKKGQMQIQTRVTQNRAEAVDLKSRETVQLDFGVTPNYLAISVSDNFGGLKKEDVFSYLRKDFSKTGVKANTTGVGIGGIIQSGLSLLFIARPNHRTQAILFIPVVENFRSFRTSFRFFSFIQR